jgi:hypothetical protein
MSCLSSEGGGRRQALVHSGCLIIPNVPGSHKALAAAKQGVVDQAVSSARVLLPRPSPPPHGCRDSRHSRGPQATGMLFDRLQQVVSVSCSEIAKTSLARLASAVGAAHRVRAP